jgi:hypothetical protein
MTSTLTRRAVIALACLAVIGGALPHVAAAAGHVSVFFVRGEQLAPVPRTGAGAADAVHALIAGPTRAEKAKGFRGYLDPATRLRSVQVANGVATVDLNEPFAAGSNTDALLARLAQLVRTVTVLPGIDKVLLLIDGQSVTARFPGVNTGEPITFRSLQTPNTPVPVAPRLRLPPPDPAVAVLQRQLIELGYLLKGDDDGRFGPATQNAILAFQKWEGLGRTGLLDARTKSRLSTATHPSPRTRGASGRRAEILLDRQVALLIENNQVVRTIAVSSGKPSTPTPPGDYRVYAKIQRWWSTPFREWLPWALPFVGGIAFHEFGVVPVYPASHGCVRQDVSVARWTYDFASVGMPVKVLVRS